MWRCHTVAEAFFQVLNYSPVNLRCEIQMLQYCPGFRQCLIPFCVTAGSLHQPSFISNHSEVMDYYSYSLLSSESPSPGLRRARVPSPLPVGSPSIRLFGTGKSPTFPALHPQKHSGKKNHKQTHLSAFAGGVALHIELQLFH